LSVVLSKTGPSRAVTGLAQKKRIVDLQRALRGDRATHAFLVLGDPGAGKSVALRKLARDMLDEVGRTGRVPIYINLREWLSKEYPRHASRNTEQFKARQTGTPHNSRREKSTAAQEKPPFGRNSGNRD